MGPIRVGVDVGGTFTDVVLFDGRTGRQVFVKVPSTPADPAAGVLRGLLSALEVAGAGPADVGYFAHGSTVATNALLEGRGARVGLVTTAGFKDLLEIGRQTRPHLYDLQVDKPEPLVPRDLRLEVRERVYADGRVLVPLHREDVVRAARRLRAAGVEAAAVCYLHGYRYPDHELVTAQILAGELPGVFLSVAHRVLPEFREFERLSTTVVNAYLGPVVARYVLALGRRLADLGLSCRPYMTQSNGGVMTLEVAAAHTHRTVLSGPSSGVVGAAYLAGLIGLKDILTFDMGGTSADLSLVPGGQPLVAAGREVAGYPVKTPMVDVKTIGAGGGSIARVDAGGLLKVGPESAGAEPGPACYGLGGEDPTVTDANVVLGTLNPEYLLGGRMPIDAGKAWRAVEKLAARLGLDVLTTARGIVSVVVAGMARAARVVSIQRGYDPRDFALVAFGGAGPLHAGWLARQLGIRRVLVPTRPGLLCALGLLVTNIRADFVQSHLVPAERADPGLLGRIFGRLEREADAWLAGQGIPPGRRVLRRAVDMRYLGQNYELTVPVPAGPFGPETLPAVVSAFYRAHEQAYGYAVAGEPAELVSFRVEAVGLLDKLPFAAGGFAGAEPDPGALVGRRQVYLDEGWVGVPVYDRERLRPGNVVAGPALVEQMDATTLILPGQAGRVDGLGNILIEEG